MFAFIASAIALVIGFACGSLGFRTLLDQLRETKALLSQTLTERDAAREYASTMVSREDHDRITKSYRSVSEKLRQIQSVCNGP